MTFAYLGDWSSIVILCISIDYFCLDSTQFTQMNHDAGSYRLAFLDKA